jgi:hypothetical protein
MRAHRDDILTELHVTAIFDRVGVGSRAELIGRVLLNEAH